MPNRLIHEKSPYLLQHAHNPVDWYPWGEEAFERARELDRPVFLSVGYATCHWCHVMERESFEDPEVAALMNEAFVNVKVDREERPDIDGIYMTVAQLATGQGGWPLTILMTADREPFLAATYIPPDDRHGRVGMRSLIPRVRSAWEGDRASLTGTATSIRERLEVIAAADLGGRSLDEGTLRQAFTELSGAFDREHGGFGGAPKFPTPHRLLFLLRHGRRGVEHATRMVEHTLDAMRAGGVFDQIGFGFHRYSTDREWLVPHFEKMLYDQAMLMLAYAESAAAGAGSGHHAVVREIAAYVLRDLTSPAGTFYSAEDADSEGEEGRFYLWSLREAEEALAEEELRVAVDAWGLESGGNYRDEATGRPTGLNILHVRRPPDDPKVLESARRSLFALRIGRVRPLLDDKVLTDWNGLMIAALARAGQVLRDPGLVEAARRASEAIAATMWRDGRLLHRYRDGEAGLAANLDDYAFLAWAETELYQATLEPVHLRRALDVTDEMVRRFHDEERGGFFFSPEGREDLIVRRRELYDGAAPSGNSVAFYNLLRLARLTGRPGYEELAARTSSAFSRQVAAQPSAFCFFLCALGMALGSSRELVVAGEEGAEDTRALLAVAREGWNPDLVLLLRPPGSAGDEVVGLAPFLRDFGPVEGRAAAYLCSGFTCERPVCDPDGLRELLREG